MILDSHYIKPQKTLTTFFILKKLNNFDLKRENEKNKISSTRN